MCTSSPKAPAAVPILPEAPTAPNVTGSAAGMSAEERRKRAAAGQSGNILTSSQGVTGQANTDNKVLLGS